MNTNEVELRDVDEDDVREIDEDGLIEIDIAAYVLRRSRVSP